MFTLFRKRQNSAKTLQTSPVEETQQPAASAKQTVYSELQELVALRFHLKQRKLNHRQHLIASNLGNHHATRKGRGMTFSEVREYQAGDDIRHIDWRVTARTQKAHTKVFIEEHERPTILVCEQTPALFFGSKTQLKTAQVLNIASILAWCSLNQNERVGGLVFNHQHALWVAPKRSQRAALSFLQQSISLQTQLHRPGNHDSSAWPKTLTQLAKTAKPGSQVFLIGDMVTLANTSLSSLQSLRKHLDIIALHIVDPIEETLPELGWLSLTKTFGEEAIQLDSFRGKTRQEYQASFEQAWQQTRQHFLLQQIPLYAINNQQSALSQLLTHRVIV